MRHIVGISASRLVFIKVIMCFIGYLSVPQWGHEDGKSMIVIVGGLDSVGGSERDTVASRRIANDQQSAGTSMVQHHLIPGVGILQCVTRSRNHSSPTTSFGSHFQKPQHEHHQEQQQQQLKHPHSNDNSSSNSPVTANKPNIIVLPTLEASDGPGPEEEERETRVEGEESGLERNRLGLEEETAGGGSDGDETLDDRTDQETPSVDQTSRQPGRDRTIWSHLKRRQPTVKYIPQRSSRSKSSSFGESTKKTVEDAKTSAAAIQRLKRQAATEIDGQQQPQQGAMVEPFGQFPRTLAANQIQPGVRGILQQMAASMILLAQQVMSAMVAQTSADLPARMSNLGQLAANLIEALTIGNPVISNSPTLLRLRQPPPLEQPLASGRQTAAAPLIEAISRIIAGLVLDTMRNISSRLRLPLGNLTSTSSAEQARPPESLLQVAATTNTATTSSQHRPKAKEKSGEQDKEKQFVNMLNDMTAGIYKGSGDGSDGPNRRNSTGSSDGTHEKSEDPTARALNRRQKRSIGSLLMFGPFSRIYMALMLQRMLKYQSGVVTQAVMSELIRRYIMPGVGSALLPAAGLLNQAKQILTNGQQQLQQVAAGGGLQTNAGNGAPKLSQAGSKESQAPEGGDGSTSSQRVSTIAAAIEATGADCQLVSSLTAPGEPMLLSPGENNQQRGPLQLQMPQQALNLMTAMARNPAISIDQRGLSFNLPLSQTSLTVPNLLTSAQSVQQTMLKMLTAAGTGEINERALALLQSLAGQAAASLAGSDPLGATDSSSPSHPPGRASPSHHHHQQYPPLPPLSHHHQHHHRPPHLHSSAVPKQQYLPLPPFPLLRTTNEAEGGGGSIGLQLQRPRYPHPAHDRLKPTTSTKTKHKAPTSPYDWDWLHATSNNNDGLAGLMDHFQATTSDNNNGTTTPGSVVTPSGFETYLRHASPAQLIELLRQTNVQQAATAQEGNADDHGDELAKAPAPLADLGAGGERDASQLEAEIVRLNEIEPPPLPGATSQPPRLQSADAIASRILNKTFAVGLENLMASSVNNSKQQPFSSFGGSVSDEAGQKLLRETSDLLVNSFSQLIKGLDFDTTAAAPTAATNGSSQAGTAATTTTAPSQQQQAASRTSSRPQDTTAVDETVGTNTTTTGNEDAQPPKSPIQISLSADHAVTLMEKLIAFMKNSSIGSGSSSSSSISGSSSSGVGAINETSGTQVAGSDQRATTTTKMAQLSWANSATSSALPDVRELAGALAADAAEAISPQVFPGRGNLHEETTETTSRRLQPTQLQHNDVREELALADGAGLRLGLPADDWQSARVLDGASVPQQQRQANMSFGERRQLAANPTDQIRQFKLDTAKQQQRPDGQLGRVLIGHQPQQNQQSNATLQNLHGVSVVPSVAKLAPLQGPKVSPLQLQPASRQLLRPGDTVGPTMSLRAVESTGGARRSSPVAQAGTSSSPNRVQSLSPPPPALVREVDSGGGQAALSSTAASKVGGKQTAPFSSSPPPIGLRKIVQQQQSQQQLIQPASRRPSSSLKGQLVHSAEREDQGRATTAQPTTTKISSYSDLPSPAGSNKTQSHQQQQSTAASEKGNLNNLAMALNVMNMVLLSQKLANNSTSSGGGSTRARTPPTNSDDTLKLRRPSNGDSARRAALAAMIRQVKPTGNFVPSFVRLSMVPAKRSRLKSSASLDGKTRQPKFPYHLYGRPVSDGDGQPMTSGKTTPFPAGQASSFSSRPPPASELEREGSSAPPLMAGNHRTSTNKIKLNATVLLAPSPPPAAATSEQPAISSSKAPSYHFQPLVVASSQAANSSNAQAVKPNDNGADDNDVPDKEQATRWNDVLQHLQLAS